MKIVYHGGGYTGFTGAIFAARAGHDVLVYEPDAARVEAISNGREPVVGIAEWLGPELMFDPALRGRISATSEFDRALAWSNVHLFSVPTERDGDPMFEVLNAALDRVLLAFHPNRAKAVLIVESTVHPNFTVQTHERLRALATAPYSLIIAPRRDWFVGAGQTVETCERVIGTDTAEDRVLAEQLYGPISKLIHWTDTETAEIVKQLENAVLYAGVTFLMGFALSYPEKDVREIVRLAGTHWRLPKWYLPLGIAGYCVPLGMKYLTFGDAGFEYGQVALKTEAAFRAALLSRLVEEGCKRVAILGVSDKANQRIQHLSPSLTLFHGLKAEGIDVVVHDGQFTAAEVGIPEASWIMDPAQLGADAVVVNTPYPEYRAWVPEVSKARLVIDGPGIFEVDRRLFERLGVKYFRVGDPGWLEAAR